MKFIYRKSFLNKQLITVCKYFVIILFGFSSALTIPTITNAQIPFSTTSNGSESAFTPWWELGKVRVCGKLLCTNVRFPYFPYDIVEKSKFTIAARTDLQNPQKTSEELEIRANVVEQTLLSLFKRIVRYHHEQAKQDGTVESQNINIKDWFAFNKNKKQLHPLTPKIEVGIKNAQTIIFTPAQPELGLSQETIVTITEDDSIHNGKPVAELANQWRNIIRQDLSEALWGYEFDHVFPFGRLQIIVIIFILITIPIVVLTILSRLVRSLDGQLKLKIQELNELAKQEQQASFLNSAESSEKHGRKSRKARGIP